MNDENAREQMQSKLKEKYQFFSSLVEIDSMFDDNKEFVNQLKKELITDKVYVYTTKGEIIELPKGSNIIDFVYKVSVDLGNTMIGATINNHSVDFDYILKNKDRVKVLTDDLSYGPREDWIEKAHTAYAKKKIKEFNCK